MQSAPDDILTISQLNRRVRDALESAWPQVWVCGEISNFTRAASGHWYFTVKDDAASVSAVMFRRQAQALGFVPKVGDRLELRATVTLFEARGDYQLQVAFMRRAGQGDRYAAFLALRDKLVAEGLCDAGRKRPVVPVPRAVGVVTSLAAAALQDVLTALARRAPHVRVVIYPAAVQGGEAASQLRAAFAQAVARRGVDGTDTLLLVRGGGSLEDLWSFNDETLARMVATSPIPVVSGVGHETDFTLVDFVADVRAPTPTAAAELACQPLSVCQSRLQALVAALDSQQQATLAQLALRLDRAVIRLISPAQRLAQQRQQVQQWTQRLRRTLPDLVRHGLEVERLTRRLHQHWVHAHTLRQTRLASACQALRALDPQQVLERGFVLVRDAQGAPVTRAQDVSVGQMLALQFAQGTVSVQAGDGGQGSPPARGKSATGRPAAKTQRKSVENRR